MPLPTAPGNKVSITELQNSCTPQKWAFPGDTRDKHNHGRTWGYLWRRENSPVCGRKLKESDLHHTLGRMSDSFTITQ